MKNNEIEIHMCWYGMLAKLTHTHTPPPTQGDEQKGWNASIHVT